MSDGTLSEINLNRRNLMSAVAGAGLAGVALLDARVTEAAQKAVEPLKGLAADVKAVSIKSVESFDVVVPQPKDAKPNFFGQMPGRINVTRVTTDSGVRGYSFMGTTAEQLKAAQPVLVGKDLFGLERYLNAGLINWGAIEEAMWDAIGRIAGQPVHRLLGGALRATLPVYITYVWPGDSDDPAITPRIQAQQASIVKQAGFKAMKIRVFRKNTDIDAEACAEILAVGGPGFRVMVDRTATQPGLWTYDQALYAAHALEKAGCYWLEEPLARDDYDGPARLQREAGILITGGEGYRGLGPYRECVLHGTYHILQPELRAVAGILTARKVGVIAEAWGLQMAPHGTSGLAWAGRVQCSAAMGSLIQEISVLTPPALPDDICAPYLPLVHGEQPFKFRDGEVIVPQGPGLGLNVDDSALARFRVEGIESRLPRPPGTGAPVVPR